MGNGEKGEEKGSDEESRGWVSELYHSATRAQEGKDGKGNVKCPKAKTEEWLREKKKNIGLKREGSW